jgi:hypothetical protein
MGEYYNKFVELIRPFHALWNSVRVTCVAVGFPGERRSVTTRLVLREEALPRDQAFRKIHWLEPLPEVLISVVDFPKSLAVQILLKAIEGYHVDLETDSTLERVLIRWPVAENTVNEAQPTRWSSFSWHEPYRLENRWARNQFGEDRTCLALTGTGDYIRNLMPDKLYRQVSSKLRLHPPRFDGIDAIYGALLPGIRYQISDQVTFEAVFPLPLDLEQSEDGGVALRAPTAAAKGQTQVIINFKPDKTAPAARLTNEDAGSTEDGRITHWSWPIPWPHGTESGKASLFYDGEEVSSIDLRRWPAAGSLRAAIDCYFDPEHRFLQAALFGGNQNKTKGRSSQAFEMAVVRLMNLLGVPLVWYGKGVSEGRNDAAGLVDRKQERVVVLGECAAEKPEAKFSALRDRAQRLTESLAGEAEVLPVVFTKVDPPRSVFEAAINHGISLVGRAELGTLFNMLSATVGGQDALCFLRGQMSSIQLNMNRRGAI